VERVSRGIETIIGGVIMPFVAVDDNGDETLFDLKPERGKNGGWIPKSGYCPLPDGSIEEIIGRKLTWDDDPVKVIIQH
jgi:hypothetical protein